MEIINSKRTLRWFLVVCWVVLIYSTLYIARPVCEFLRQHIWFTATINFLIIFTAVFTVMWSFRKGRKFSIWNALLLMAVFAGYGLGLIWLDIPEERIHLLEYGVLAVLIYRAVVIDFQPKWAYGTAFLLTSMLGLVDEGIQYILPNRYFTIPDVLLNSISAILGLLLIFSLYGRQRI